MVNSIKGIAVEIDSIVGDVTAVATLIEDEPADDTEYAREHIDSKALAKNESTRKLLEYTWDKPNLNEKNFENEQHRIYKIYEREKQNECGY